MVCRTALHTVLNNIIHTHKIQLMYASSNYDTNKNANTQAKTSDKEIIVPTVYPQN